MKLLRKLFCTLLIALGVSAALATPAEATHGRYGHLTWKQLTGNNVEFTLITAWRRNFFSPLPTVGSFITTSGNLGQFNYGNGTSGTLQHEVIEVNAAANWILCRLVVNRSYSGPGPWNVVFTGCCRISTSQNGADDWYNLRTIVNLANNDESPSSSLPPIIYLQRNGVRTFSVPATDPDVGNTLRWRLAAPGGGSSAESGIVGAVTHGGQALTINANTGLATWNVLASQQIGWLWDVQVVVEERSPTNQLLTSVPVDFLIEILEEAPNTVPPFVGGGSPACGGSLPVLAGSNISFTIEFGDSDVGDVVTISSGGVPAGATMTPSLPVSGNPVSSVFSWTPSIGQIGNYIVQFVGTDSGNNQTICSYTIVVTGQPPVCDAGGPYLASCICANDCATVTLDGSGSSDPDGGPLTYAWSAPGIVFDDATSVTPTGCFPVGLTTATLVVTDNQGLSTTCTVDINVSEDVTPPTITCPADFTVECLADVPACNPNDATATDDCSGVTVTCADGPLVGDGCGGTITRTYTATDACGNVASCEQIITIDDNTAPDISCPAGFTVACVADIPACDPNDATASDNCSAVTVTCADGPLVGDGCGGTITRTFTATDACGNVASCEQIITVIDNIAPSVSCPADVTIQCDESTDPLNTGSASGSDNCGSVTISFTDSESPGSCPQERTIARVWTATDLCGNSTSCTQVITVEDTEAPSMTCPPDVTIACDDSSDPAATGTPSAVDNCDPAPFVSHSDAISAGGCAHEYTITRSWVATDACGNSFTCVQTITVEDNDGPVLGCPADVTVACDDPTDPATTGEPSVVDNCDPAPSISHSDAVTPGSCDLEYTIVRTWVAVDACGNSNTCVQTITVEDTEGPIMTCPEDLIVECGESTDPASTGSASGVDACDPAAPTITYADVVTPGPCSGEYEIARTWTGTDACGNSSSCTQIISVQDNTAPTITFCPPNITVTGLENLPPCDVEAISAVDACGEVTLTCTRSSFGGVGCSGTPIDIVYTYTATDDCGNAASCSRIVTVILEPCNFFVSLGAEGGAETEAVLGSQITVPVRIDTLNNEVGRLAFAFGFDASVLTLLDVTRGDAISLWDHFTYEISAGPESGSRVVALRANATSGSGGQFPTNMFLPRGTIANLHFAVAGDRSLGNALSTIWSSQVSCDDNCLMSRDEQIAYVRSDVSIELCGAMQAQLAPVIDISAAQIRIKEPVERRGDINVNGVANEVGDAVIFIDYLSGNPSAFSADPVIRAMQLEATDVNSDGIRATVADLIYLIRIVAGQVDPASGAKVSPYLSEATLETRREGDFVHVTAISPVDLGGVLLTFRHEGLVTEPVVSSSVDAMDVRLRSTGQGEFKVLVYGWETAARVSAGQTEFLSIGGVGGGSIELIDAQVSDADGGLLSTRSVGKVIPARYDLLQNYPNPFNAGTVIPLHLDQGGAWSVSVYNVTGQLVRSLEGNNPAGVVHVGWDGRTNDGATVPSGIYFYRALFPSGDALTRKMTLLK